MDYATISEKNDFQDWFDYLPLDFQISKYKNNDGKIIVTGLKIYDVYNAFANARFSFMSAGQGDYGDLCEKNDAGRMYTKAHFLIMAIMEYNVCWDMSMQVLWAFMHDESYRKLNGGNYFKFQEKCKRKTFIDEMNREIRNGRNDLEKVKKIYIKYSKKTAIKEIQRLCNYIKHNGTLYFEGLDNNFEKMYSSINYKAINSFPRESVGFNEIEKKLLSFHIIFQKYFKRIIKEIMPSDYFSK